MKGVTLIELMVTLAIAAFLMLLGLPSLQQWAANSRIRAAAEGVLSGLQNARVEALKRNLTVELALTSDNPTAATVDSLTTAATGTNWVIRFIPQGSTDYQFVQAWNGPEGIGGASSGVAYGASTDVVSFNGLGRAAPAGGATFNFTNATAGACVGGGGTVRCLRIAVSGGGDTRLCDPAISDPGDSRAC
jgi:type IV fimbrial biogenesis protein FimT